MSIAVYKTHMGDDLLVVNAARVSMDKESINFTTREQLAKGSDEGLITYLATHGHWTPFSHPQICMMETVPIFIARQRFKHMVGFTYNEISRRYVSDDPEFFTPTSWRKTPEGSVKQGSAGDHPYQTALNSQYEKLVNYCEEEYYSFLKQGVAPEQARMLLPQSMMTSYYVTGSLAAWARATKQRLDSHAQVEIQDLAKQWSKIIEPLFPYTWKELIK